MTPVSPNQVHRILNMRALSSILISARPTHMLVILLILLILADHSGLPDHLA